MRRELPQVQKVEPPSWWAGSSMNPVRLLIRGNGLKDARVRTAGAGVRVVGAPISNERGTYLFVNWRSLRSLEPALAS